MKTIMILAIAFFANAISAFGGECSDAAKTFGMGRHGSIPGNCIGKTLDFANANQKHVSKSGKYISAGYANVLMIRETKPLKDILIIGPATLLKNIAATTLDETNREIYALDSISNAIYVFDSELPGNVGPKRYLKSDDLKAAVSIAVDADKNVMIVVYPKSVSVYGRLAYNEGRRPEHSTKKISSIEAGDLNANNITSAAYDTASGVLSLKDTNRVISVLINSSGQARLQ